MYALYSTYHRSRSLKVIRVVVKFMTHCDLFWLWSFLFNQNGPSFQIHFKKAFGLEAIICLLTSSPWLIEEQLDS